MDVIDRYFRTLRVLLPRDQRDDIIRELSEEVDSQIAEREAALGRPLEQVERAGIIGQYGHPLLTAARYRPQRSLIGPVVFPYYWIALRLALALIAVGHVLGAIILLVGDLPGPPAGALVADAIGTALKVAAWITGIAAIADIALNRSRMLQRWNPIDGRSLPEHAHRVVAAVVSAVPGSKRQPPAALTRRSQANEPSAARFVVGLVVGAWWLGGLTYPALFFGTGATDLTWGPAMARLYPVLVVVQLTMFIEQFVSYFRPDRNGIFRVTRLIWLVAGVTLIALVATADHQWMVWRGESAPRANAIILQFAGRDVSLIGFVNLIWSIVFIVVAALSVWSLVKVVLRKIRGPLMTAHA